MRITTLIENLVYQNGLYAEHGLSLYIEDENTKILFDTGQTSSFIKNAKKLNIDLSQINYVVLSHGHYDHTGGLIDFLKINSTAKIIIKQQAFQNKVSIKSSNIRFIGMPIKQNEIKNDILYLTQSLQISTHIIVKPNIKIFNSTDTHFDYMNIQTKNNLLPDTFKDELYLLINHKNAISVISGCSHRGISNIVLSALEGNQNQKLNFVIGGFHLKPYNSKKTKFLINFFKNINITKIGVCHCTGIESFSDFKQFFKSTVFYNYTGNIITL